MGKFSSSGRRLQRIPATERRSPEHCVGDKEQPTPLARGYATFGSDSGHHKHYLILPDIFNLRNADFGMNDEERRNFASDSLKKTHDVAIKLMELRYGPPVVRMYFVGGSTGGREAMELIDRWPFDYDGVMAPCAPWNEIETDLQSFGFRRPCTPKERTAKEIRFVNQLFQVAA